MFDFSILMKTDLSDNRIIPILMGCTLALFSLSLSGAALADHPERLHVAANFSAVGELPDEQPAAHQPAIDPRQKDKLKSRQRDFEEIKINQTLHGQKPPRANHKVLAVAEGREIYAVVVLDEQRAYLFIDNVLAIDTPVSTGREGMETPTGVFPTKQKVTSAYIKKYRCTVHYWQRLNYKGIGMHSGRLPGYPASHGCVRLPYEVSKLMYQHMPEGTPIHVISSRKKQPEQKDEVLLSNNT